MFDYEITMVQNRGLEYQNRTFLEGLDSKLEPEPRFVGPNPNSFSPKPWVESSIPVRSRLKKIEQKIISFVNTEKPKLTLN